MLKLLRQTNRKRRLLEFAYICVILISGCSTLIMAEVLKIPYGTWGGMIFLYTVPMLGIVSIFLDLIHYYKFENGKSNKHLFTWAMIFVVAQVLLAVSLYP